jgi:CheY-like chemotaxis protein/anti-sigma regulatory factor (Ser/Thr protein kinase)
MSRQMLPPFTRDEELERLNRLKDDFLVTLTHELRTPMTVVLGWASTLRAKGLDQPFAAQAIEAIERNARLQLALIENVLDLSDIVQGRMQLQVEEVDLLAIVGEAVASAGAAAFSRQIEIRWAPVSQRLVVAGDPRRLRQVVWHLLSNAVRFTPAGGRVVVRARRDDDRVTIRVSDNGMGIDRAFLPHLFEPFRQADASSSREHGGLGLGLAIVRHLVELHGGQVRAESRGTGKGATFTVSLPLRASAPLPAPRRTRARRPRRGETVARRARPATRVRRRPPTADRSSALRLDALVVLLVQADGDAAAVLASHLEAAGAIVRRAATSAQALRAFTAELRPSVIIVDVGERGVEAYDLLGRVRELPAAHGGRAPAIALTRHGDADGRDRALAEGYQVHIERPVWPAALIDAVATLAGREVWS